MLTRAISTLVLVPIVIWLVLYSSLDAFRWISLAIFMLAATEWLNFMGLSTLLSKVIWFLIFFTAFLLALHLPPFWVLLIGALSWVIAFILLFYYHNNHHRGIFFAHQKNVIGLMGVLALVPAWIAFNLLREKGTLFLLLYLCMLWSTDTGAYLAGKWLGKHKLAPSISPKKTIEGAIGGLLLLWVVAAIGFFYYGVGKESPLLYWIAVTLLNIFSVVGDLFESIFKRLRGMKDSGKVIPGHGGILDRIDGMIASLPIFVLLSLFFF
jgi:phosphatidate cytidylyltransferase